MHSTDPLTVDELATLPAAELAERLRAPHDRIEARVAAALNENRDLTPAECTEAHFDRAQIGQVKLAIELQERNAARRASEIAARSRQIGDAIEMHQRSGYPSPLFPSSENLRLLEGARRDMASLSVIEARAAIRTTDMGTAREYGPNGLLAPRTLWRSSGIPTTAPDGYAGVVPQFTLPAGVALVAEGNAHNEFDAVAPDSVTIGRAGAWSDLTSEGLLSTSLQEISSAHSRIIARNIDAAVVTKIEGSDSGLDIDEALVTVAAECACDVSDLWIAGDPAAIATLAGTAVFTPANGPDIGSYATRYGGATLYPTPTASALTIFYPQSFRAFASPLASAVVVDPTTGSQRFGQWQFFGIGQSLVGSAVTVGAGSGSS